jgi:GNAT superfamily N-acetyltransferase
VTMRPSTTPSDGRLLQHDTVDRSADEAAPRAMRRAHTLLARLIPGGRASTDENGIETLETPMPIATMSGLVLPDHRVSRSQLRSSAERFVERRMPWSLNVAGAETGQVAELAAELGMTRDVRPTLEMPLHPDLALGLDHGSLAIVHVSTAADRRRWTETCDVAFGLAPGTTSGMAAPQFTRAPEIRTYLGLRAGHPVATAVSMLDDLGWLGLFTVGTVPEARRTGVAGQLVRHVLVDGITNGAHTAFLETSPMARALYEQIGFRDAPAPTVYFCAHEMTPPTRPEVPRPPLGSASKSSTQPEQEGQ